MRITAALGVSMGGSSSALTFQICKINRAVAVIDTAIMWSDAGEA